MKAKRLLTIICSAVLFAANFSAFGCSNLRGDDFIKLEAEKAVIEPAYTESGAEVCRAASKSENVTSGGKYVGKFLEQNKITWYFNSEKTTLCNFSLSVANANPSAESFTAISGETFTFSVNGERFDFTDCQIGKGSVYSDSWQTLSLGELPVLKGINYAEFIFLDTVNLLNVDYLAIDTSQTNVKEHLHAWSISSTPATCEEQGTTHKYCNDCKFGYDSEIISAVGHDYTSYHYDDATMKMVSKCSRCTSQITANTPSSKYFGEVFTSEDMFKTRANKLVYEAESAFVNASAGLSHSTSYIEKDDGTMNEPSGGKSVGNISRVGNYIRFTVESQDLCKADLVFKMANVLYVSTGIGELNPMSNYVYCKVNGEQVDISFVSFPGYDEHKYYEWRYVVIKNVDFSEGLNYIEIGPKNSGSNITMPNTDALFIYTDYNCVRAIKTYQLNDITVGEYQGNYKNSVQFTSDENGNFNFNSGKIVSRADFVLTLNCQQNIENLAKNLDLSINDKTVKVEGVNLIQGENTFIVRGVPVNALNNQVKVEFSQGVTLSGVAAYSDSELIPALIANVDEKYDYLKNQSSTEKLTPTLILEAENADFGASVSSREGVAMIERNIYENTEKVASGNAIVGNFAKSGNALTFKFDMQSQENADVTIMLASANYSETIGGNRPTDNLQTLITLTVNGVAVDLSNVTLPIDGIADYYSWQAVTVNGVNLIQGENEIKLQVLNNVSPNIDVLYVYSND
ncbi:MAG: hypothetical protein J6B04_05015 [Clostridia bacterium]|nr:hypothetical protein [Clostridia bacterium]